MGTAGAVAVSAAAILLGVEVVQTNLAWTWLSKKDKQFELI
jgi:hypothetical protein